MYFQPSNWSTSIGAILLCMIFQIPRWKPQFLHEHSKQLQYQTCLDVTLLQSSLWFSYSISNYREQTVLFAYVKHTDYISFQTESLKLVCQTHWRLYNLKTKIIVDKLHYKQSKALNNLFLQGISQTGFRYCKDECAKILHSRICTIKTVFIMRNAVTMKTSFN